MELALLIFLTLLNGLFAMSEMALASSRKARLQVLAETGDAGALTAIELHDNPTQFLSTVQIGITTTGDNDQLAAAPASTTATIPNTHDDSKKTNTEKAVRNRRGSKGVQPSGNKVLAKRKPNLRNWL